ncbi:S-layer homology domain-containing protein [Flavonifractor sp. An10]|uniref:S-layer homology domain-containing protein n=1 Tax=Flavonifractor sp. An10 TaxID=1965537 RepID=UPI000B39DD3E|nr:S-layer homology domain-containing protein [Flavonifractor sp. An10]OUQ82903.1 hypothetical protein B5E42_09550 [Flavonifractor sp. An10]
MRNLKRALSLLLAAAMLIGMMVVGASAVSYNDFSDRGEIVNKDAVSMLTTLEIIEGKPDGSYAPGENVDRAQMAKMISVMLSNNQNCDDLYMNVNSGLTDISANWAKGYINYCYTLGVIAGRGNGTFDPSANVTAVEAAKMLLTALGYEAEIEGLVGDDWALNTAALAHELGIFRNFDKDVSAPLNRDDAALLIYNAMDVEMIEQYQNGYALSYADHRTILSYVFGVIRVEGVVVANEWAQLQQTDSDEALREGRTTLANVVWYDSTTSNTRVEEGVKETEPVTFNVTTPVEYMGKAVTMYVEKTTILANSKVLGVATDDEANVINFTAATEDTVKDYLKGTGVAVNEDTEYYVNYGYMADADDAIDWVNDYLYGYKGSDFTLNGVEVQVIDNDDDGIAEYVLYLQETLSEVQRYNESKETLTFFAPDRDSKEKLNGKTASTTIDTADMVSVKKVSLEGVTTTENLSLETEDLILYVQYGGRTYVANPQIVTGNMTRIDRDREDELFITIDDGDNYYQSFILDVASIVDVDVENFDIDNKDVRDDAPGFDVRYDFILDSHGYIVAYRPAEEVVTNYALVLDSAWTQNALDRSGQIKILMADGTEKQFNLNWDDSADAFTSIDNIRGALPASVDTDDEKLEYYLGSRDVVQDGSGDKINDKQDTYATGLAAGSIITYSLNEAGDELTIESVLQGNTFETNPTSSIEIDQTHNPDETAGVADNGDVIFMDGVDDNNTTNNLQYYATNGYDNGYGNIRVTGTYEDEKGNWHDDTRSYAVDLNTVAFYWYKDGEDYVYGVATGWNNMSDVDAGTDVQVIPALEKTTNGEYQASNLAAVILFEAEPNTVAANYMLVLSANAVGKDKLELNVVFEDGTAATIDIDDKGDFDDEDDTHYMRAWTYSENADGTYDIGSMWTRANGYADLLINGTIELNGYRHIALPADANVWDVTEVDRGGDDVPTGVFQRNINVNAVVIVSEGQVRTAWIWDLDPNDITGTGWNFNWDLTNYERVYPYMGTWSQWQIQSYLVDETNVMVVGDLTLTNDLVIPEDVILQVEGDLHENGYDVSGLGTLRVRGDYYVGDGIGAENPGDGIIATDTQVGGDLLLTESTEINARVGVLGSVVGNGGDTSYNGVATDPDNRYFDLDVNDYLYAGEDIIVAYLTVNGHAEADDVYAYGIKVTSKDTLIARGSICLYDNTYNSTNGYLTVGDGTAAGAGSVVVGDMLIDPVTGDTANVTVNADSTLTMNVGADMDIDGTLTVNTKGKVTYEADGAIHYLKAGSVVIDGEVYVPGTIEAGSVALNNGGKLSVITKPDSITIANGGELVYLDDEGLEEQPGTDVPTNTLLTNLTIKGEKVTLSGNGGYVTLPYDKWTNTTDDVVKTTTSGVTVKAYAASDSDTPLDKKDALDKDTTALYVQATKGLVSEEYVITVKLTAGQTDSELTSLTVKGVKVDLSKATGEGTEEDPYVLTVSDITAEQNSTATLMEIGLPSGATKAVKNGSNQDVADSTLAGSPAVKSGWNWTITVTSQDKQSVTYYKVIIGSDVEAEWTATVGSITVVNEKGTAKDGATVSGVEAELIFDNTKDLTFTVTAKDHFQIKEVKYLVDSDASQYSSYTVIEDATGSSYTIPATALKDASATDKLNIRVVVTEDPKVIFSTTKPCYVNDKQVTEAYAENGTLTFATSVEIEAEGAEVQKGEVDGAGRTTYTLTGITKDVTVSDYTAAGGR